MQSSLQSTLFHSIIPSDVPWSPPLSGVGSPQGRQRGVPGQLYTQTDGGQLWCKGTTDPVLGWFMVAANQGHPTVIVGVFYETDPRGTVQAAGPAVWLGWDKSIWVKTDSANDTSNWNLLLEYSPSLGLPDSNCPNVDSDSESEEP